VKNCNARHMIDAFNSGKYDKYPASRYLCGTTYFSLAGVERQRNTCQVQKMVMQKNVDLWGVVSGA